MLSNLPKITQLGLEARTLTSKPMFFYLLVNSAQKEVIALSIEKRHHLLRNP